jgi:hypothetical protein
MSATRLNEPEDWQDRSEIVAGDDFGFDFADPAVEED